MIKKLAQRLTDPVFYRKRTRDLLRRFRSFDDSVAPGSVQELGAIEKAVVVVAHPDDETFCSGLLAALAEQGTKITVLCLTRGEGGPTGGKTREELGAARELEMRKSCECLGVASLEFLNHIDPLARGYRVFAPDVSAEALGQQISPAFDGADLVISHGSSGEYWHPAHLLIYAAVKAVASTSSFAWITFMARDTEHPIQKIINQDDSAHFRFDVSSYASVREKSLACHESQLGLFARFSGGESYRDFLTVTGTESYCFQKK